MKRKIILVFNFILSTVVDFFLFAVIIFFAVAFITKVIPSLAHYFTLWLGL